MRLNISTIDNSLLTDLLVFLCHGDFFFWSFGKIMWYNLLWSMLYMLSQIIISSVRPIGMLTVIQIRYMNIFGKLCNSLTFLDILYIHLYALHKYLQFVKLPSLVRVPHSVPPVLLTTSIRSFSFSFNLLSPCFLFCLQYKVRHLFLSVIAHGKKK